MNLAALRSAFTNFDEKKLIDIMTTKDPVTNTPVAGAQNQAQDNRRAERKSTRTLGYLICAATREQLECTIYDMSATGAKATINTQPRKAFEPAIRIPEEFRLAIPHDGIEIDGKLAWKDDLTIGVTFLSAFRPLRQGPI